MKKIEPVKNIYELTAADVATLKQMIKEDKQGRRGSSSNKSFSHNYATKGALVPKDFCRKQNLRAVGQECKWPDSDQWCLKCFHNGDLVCRGPNRQEPCTVHSSGP